MTVEQQWWYSIDGSKQGPCTKSELRTLIENKSLTHDQLVWNKSLDGWVTLDSVQELSEILDELDADMIEPPPLPEQPTANSQQLTVSTKNDSSTAADAETTDQERVYFAPRLDSAFLAQAKIVKHGKSTALIITLLSFLGGALGILGVIGLISYWVTFYKNKEKLENIEKQLFSKHREDGLSHDISDMRNIWFRFGPAIAYALSILTVCLLIAKWLIQWLWSASNANNN